MAASQACSAGAVCTQVAAFHGVKPGICIGYSFHDTAVTRVEALLPLGAFSPGGKNGLSR